MASYDFCFHLNIDQMHPVKQQDVFEKINPSLRSFFRGKKALVEAGIEALLTLITHDKSGKSCSQADLLGRKTIC